MKINYKLLYLFLIVGFLGYGQIKDDCDVNLNKAYRYLSYLETSNNVKADSLKAIEYLKPCVKKNNPTAQLLMAQLYLNSSNEKEVRKGFRLTRKAAKQNFPLASYKLGLLFKYGIGVNENLLKATKWFKKGYKLGNQKAAYSLGYMYLKGFGGESQDYKKAVKWFKKSDYPMAKHWLAACYYLGYGVKQNKSKAKKILEDNKINKSKILLSSLEKMTKVNQLTDEENYIIDQANDFDIFESSTYNLDELTGTWEGNLIQFDWSKNSVMQRIPTIISFKRDSISDEILSEITINNKTITSYLQIYSNEVMLDEMSLNINHPYSSIEQKLQHYNLSPLKMDLIYKNGEKFITFNNETYIDDWKEPGAPISLILKKKKNITNNNIEVSDEALANLNSQENFIKLYPNPFEKDILIAYELPTNSDVSIKITNINATKFYDVINVNNQKKGAYIYNFNGSQLSTGVYIVRISYSGKIETKTIVKK